MKQYALVRPREINQPNRRNAEFALFAAFDIEAS